MLRYDLIHPPLLEALAAAGHGSKILIADGNFPAATVRHPAARMVHLNVAPGMLTVSDVLPVLMSAVNFEHAAMMDPPPELEVAAQQEYRQLLGPGVGVDLLDRFAFYDAVSAADVGLVVATGDERVYANVLLTIGLR